MKRNWGRASVWCCVGLLASSSCGGRDSTLSPVDHHSEGHQLLRSEKWVETVRNSSFSDLIMLTRPLSSADDIGTITAALWEKYVEKASLHSERVSEHQSRALRFGDKVMKFSLDKIGNKPPNGYPLYIALHGGGGTASYVNDSQWDHMKVYYKSSVDVGVYIAPRGVTDTWNLHFVDESYPLYDHLIENAIAFEDVNPNQAYVLGFSAGGDGVYQIAPRMADRWGAANMSAGHNNGVTFDNLYNTPFVLQVGEKDSAYDRNRAAAQNCIALNALRAQHGNYVHDCFIHAGGSHNSWRDNQPDGSPQSIIKDPQLWLEQGDQTVVTANTNAVHWMKNHARSPYPPSIIWDTQIAAPRSTGYGAFYLDGQTDAQTRMSRQRDLFYWLDVGPNGSAQPKAKIIAGFNKDLNRVEITKAGGTRKLRILVHPAMLDLKRPIQVAVEGADLGDTLVVPDLAVMARTLLERGDPTFVFVGEITVGLDATGRWSMMQ